MRNFVQPGDTITVPSPGTITSGSIVAVGDLIGVAAGDAASGADLDLVLTGVFDVPKVSAEAVTIGQALFLESGVVTIDSDTGSNPLVGHAVTAAPNPSASVHARLKG